VVCGRLQSLRVAAVYFASMQHKHSHRREGAQRLPFRARLFAFFEVELLSAAEALRHPSAHAHDEQRR
jgi:hypothetical protein